LILKGTLLASLFSLSTEALLAPLIELKALSALSDLQLC